MLQTRGFAFGSKASDTDAYEAAQIEPRNRRVFLQVDDRNGGRRIEAYGDLLPDLTKTPKVCD
jgi:hypothetical protein